MSNFSFYPPTTELMVAKQLNKDIKEVKSLKKNGVLDYKGRLICNLSLDEYINGGYGYNEALSINLQRKIDDKIEEYYEKIVFQKKVSLQLLKLKSKGYIKISYKNGEMIKPTNPYAIKNVAWMKKSDTQCETALNFLENNLIARLAYSYYTVSLEDERCVDTLKEYLKQIREFGLVKKIESLIDNKIQELLSIEKDTLKSLESLDKTTQNKIIKLSKLKKDIVDCEYNLSNSVMVKSSSKRKIKYESQLLYFEELEEYADYDSLSDELYVSNEILLWKKIKTKLNQKNSYGYSDFVEEFNQRDDCLSNKILSQSDILSIVNETKQLFGLKQIKSFKSAYNELKKYTDWNYDL